LRALKIEATGKSGKLFKNSELITALENLVKKGEIKEQPTLRNLLKKARIRTLSGVSPVAVLTKEMGCPGKCVYCPTEARMPKSYLSNEPAVMRAIRAKFDPYQQVVDRLTALQNCGHPIEKIELIVMGGTFSSHPKRYQTWYIRRCFQALNEFGTKKKSTKTDLVSLQRANEKAACRCVGLTLETRPDWIDAAEVANFLRLGCTRVELGVQSLSDEVLKLTQRGHGIDATKKAIRLLKNAGFKIGLHMMPNLPGSTPAKDFKMFEELFESGEYAPDQLKIYPCVVCEHSELEEWWRSGKFKPYSDKVLTNLLVKIKNIVPKWVRLSRVIRDIPAESILAGSKITNLRQVLQASGVQCSCIRCREIRDGQVDWKKVKLTEIRYSANGGEEVFLSFEEESSEKLVSLLRLRFVENSDTAFVREVHSYGSELGVGESGGSGQHRGYGKKLLLTAEKLAKAAGYKKLAVISGVGVRDYYRNQDYRLDGPYMTKQLSKKTKTR